MAKFETVTATAPGCWAPYLINGDASGIEDADIAAADAMCAEIGLGSPVDCSTEEEFEPYPDYSTRDQSGRKYAAGCLTYTFLKNTE